MATNAHIRSRGALRRALPALLLVAGVAGTLAAVGGDATSDLTEGRVAREPSSRRPALEIAFPRESYRPGQSARLRFFGNVQFAKLQLFRVDARGVRLHGRDLMDGTAVTRARTLRRVRRGAFVHVHLAPDWPSGVYFARVTATGGRVGHAPFVLRPGRLGGHPVAVVLPTLTWQAYNHRDDDRDGTPDTWYGDKNTSVVRVGRPFENRGVPPHFRKYDEPFVDWVSSSRRSADYLAQADLEQASGRRLRRAYELLVFPGHHEYVAEGEFRAVKRFRDLGGNLAFLSANNFYWKVVRRGSTIVRVAKWRDVGRPEAALVGVAYFMNDSGEHRGSWVVRNTARVPWLFAGTRLGRGSAFASGGIEADWTTPASPRRTTVVAEIPNLFGRGLSAQMTYYERGGAKVFAAGAFTLAAGCRTNPVVQRLVGNLWDYLSKP